MPKKGKAKKVVTPISRLNKRGKLRKNQYSILKAPVDPRKFR